MAAAFHLLLCDFDRGLAYVTDGLADAAPWVLRIEKLRNAGRNITCQVLPSTESGARRLVVEKFCRQHGLTLTDKSIIRV